MYSEIMSVSLAATRGEIVYTETDIGNGIPDFQIVGLGDMSVHEARKRVRGALFNSGFKFPSGRITVNLAPADVKKEGSSFDLSIAVGILTSAGIIPGDRTSNTVFIGELSLDGRIRGVNGVLPMILEGMRLGVGRFIVPSENREEGRLSGAANVYYAGSLKDAVSFLNGESADGMSASEGYRDPEEYVRDAFTSGADREDEVTQAFGILSGKEDLKDIKGQREAKRVLEIAAAGGHNLLIKGSPGCGKTMLAERLCGILPPMTFSEAREVTSVYSAAGLLKKHGGLVTERPFRKVQPGISPAALTGGGRRLLPGEITLAHNGVLFMDEFGEFGRQTAETLRGPIEEKRVILCRNGRNYEFPANFMLVGAANPCKCGYLYEEGRCRCTPAQIRNYCRGISGPLADRIDIHTEMVTVRYSDSAKEDAESSSTVRERVIRVREIQKQRYKDEKVKTNGALYGNLLEKYCVTDAAAGSLLGLVMEKEMFSLRSYGKILKISRTIADMKEKEIIGEEEIAEAVRYRPVTGRETEVYHG